jgi:hypothetical protein
MGLTTYKRYLRTEIEIGTWGTACTALLFLISAFVEFLTRGSVIWISEAGCMVGLATVAVILVRAHLPSITKRTRHTFRFLRRR